MTPELALKQIAFIRAQLDLSVAGGILDRGTLYGLCFHAEFHAKRGARLQAEIDQLQAELAEMKKTNTLLQAKISDFMSNAIREVANRPASDFHSTLSTGVNSHA